MKDGFFNSVACQSRIHCVSCRAKTTQGAKWRASLLLIDPTIKENEFACPYGVAWGATAQPSRSESAPLNRPPSRGLGDVVARITSAFGIKPCGDCKKRQQKLNELVPFKTGEPK